MLGSRFLWKLFLSFGFLILLTTSVVGVLVSRQVQQDAVAEIDQRLRNEAILLRDLTDPLSLVDPPPELQQTVARIGRETSTRLTLIRRDGTVVAESARSPEGMPSHADRPEILEARRSTVGLVSRRSSTTGEPTRYLALPLLDETEIVGYVRAAVPLAAVDAQRRRLQAAILFGAAVAAVIGLVLAFLIARKVTRPIYSVTAVAESLVQGDYKQRVPVDTEDEIGALARAFNRMASELEERIQTIDGDRNQLLAILGGMVEGVVALDAQERVVHMNRAAGRMLDADPAESLGRRIWEVSRLPAITEALHQAVSGGASTAETRISAEADDQVLELHAAPLRSGGAVLVLYDVTDLRHLEEVRRDFVANVSHELKTPITAIVGLTETILDDPDMPAATREKFLDKVRQHAQRLSVLVTDLLALSRLETGDRFLERSTLDLREPLRDALRSQIAQAEAKSLEVDAELPESPVTVRGDAEALREAVENLLSNAVRYTPEGGEVTVRLATNGHGAYIEVTDTGPGIEPRFQERIFERFYRIDRARSRELGGTGLGLSIVKHTALAHQGRVAVESQPGKGSTFRIWLPLADRS